MLREFVSHTHYREDTSFITVNTNDPRITDKDRIMTFDDVSYLTTDSVYIP
jgi:hypothetical protein